MDSLGTSSDISVAGTVRKEIQKLKIFLHFDNNNKNLLKNGRNFQRIILFNHSLIEISKTTSNIS